MSFITLGVHPLAYSWKFIINPEILSMDLPKIETINCTECSLLAPNARSSSIKACETFFPSFPNFLIGEMLVEEVSSMINEWIDSDRGDPLWLHTPVFKRKEPFWNIEKRIANGRYTCPLLNKKGQCSIYNHRHNTCFAWHCKYSSDVEEQLWVTLEKLFTESAIATALYLMNHLGLDFKKYLEVWYSWPNPYKEWFCQYNIDDKIYRELWGHWYGHEAEYYKRCFELLSSSSTSFRKQIIKFQSMRLKDCPENRPYLELMQKNQKSMYFSEHPTSFDEIVKEAPMQITNSHPRFITDLENMVLNLYRKL